MSPIVTRLSGLIKDNLSCTAGQIYELPEHTQHSPYFVEACYICQCVLRNFHQLFGAPSAPISPPNMSHSNARMPILRASHGPALHPQSPRDQYAVRPLQIILFPLRLRTRQTGFNNPKWITSIEVSRPTFPAASWRIAGFSTGLRLVKCGPYDGLSSSKPAPKARSLSFCGPELMWFREIAGKTALPLYPPTILALTALWAALTASAFPLAHVAYLFTGGRSVREHHRDLRAGNRQLYAPQTLRASTIMPFCLIPRLI